MLRAIVFAVDLEPDEQVCGPHDPWTGTQRAREELRPLRLRLEQATGAPVQFNWFVRLDPQIEKTWGRPDWVAMACPDLLREIRASGDFTGMHVHTWKWHPRRETWFNDFADAAWRAHCLKTSAEAYHAMFGKAPVASRFGHRALGPEDVAVLKRLGVRYDLTLEPGAPSHRLSSDPLAISPLPDHLRAPRAPYQPSPHDYLTPAKEEQKSGFWMVPISVTPRPHWCPMRRWPFGVSKHLPMNLVLYPRRIWENLAAELAGEPGEPSARAPLVMVLRSGDLARPRFRANFRWVMDRLCVHPGLRRCRFVGVDRAIEQFPQTHAHAATAGPFGQHRHV